ncbi:hydantoinase B/oxoprolinase family protein (plasmid) [Halarchaeum sp. CBA1220]|uniref:hydantoinase B/oxoprolinase family protein n=1 Tax=Halarchaeum sp. CBA1220 TaxID=1853682 RepID=UPI000F3AA85B|nr:hydantoinase B/oxoprolinase family protein [Halarchaeum sp. CBA1220]QLC34985.1 hydantoinase B/oxoprolinase family protein [Halarchaeum sp. CBA1220]
MTGPDIDAVTLEVVRNQLESLAEEMGQVLIRGAYSPNIKEREDCSTALFDASGRLVAQAEHIPVHLGAMPASVAAVRERDPAPGDVFVLNDPFAGGTHLPDVTMVSAIGIDARGDGGEETLGYAVSRAHHADVGGATPGSMPAGAREIFEEGLRVPPTRLVADGDVVEDVMGLLLANVRNPEERRADFRAQLAANDRGAERLRDLVAEHSRPKIEAAFDAVIDYSRERVEAELRDLPDGTYRASDVLEGDGRSEDDVPIAVTVTVDGASVTVDFDGTAGQVAGNVNAPLAVAESAVYFVLRCLTDPEIPPNQGCYDPVTVDAPRGCLLNPEPPAAVVGGNVETSQRVTDVVFAALADAAPERVPAQGQGTMNNLTIGSRDDGFAYYETLGGGAGARPTGDGLDGVQVGMTNTLNTPVEALESEYPLRVDEYALRPDSGGDGRHRGGLGVVRTVTVEAEATVSLLTERRRVAPRGVAGGGDGKTGENRIDGERVPAKVVRDVAAGTTVSIRTPGGGGHGPPADRDPAARAADEADGKTGDAD